MSKTILSDTSCLIILSRIQQLDLLQKLFGNVIITKQVADEYKDTLPAWIDVVELENTKVFDFLSHQIDIGESSSIAKALEYDDALLIIDEAKGRKISKNFNINIIGTIGVIIKAKKQGIIPQARPIIEQLIFSGFRISDEFLDIIFSNLKEE
jgi:predicted nucleic acid-binding protein